MGGLWASEGSLQCVSVLMYFMHRFLQGVCADQAKVCGYHRFQQAEFSQTVLAELRLLFEACSELLHQKVVLHAYTALLSRLQIESYLYRLLKGETFKSFLAPE